MNKSLLRFFCVTLFVASGLSFRPAQGFVPTPLEACCLEVQKGNAPEQVEICQGRSVTVESCRDVIQKMSAAAQKHWQGQKQRQGQDQIKTDEGTAGSTDRVGQGAGPSEPVPGPSPTTAASGSVGSDAQGKPLSLSRPRQNLIFPILLLVAVYAVLALLVLIKTRSQSPAREPALWKVFILVVLSSVSLISIFPDLILLQLILAHGKVGAAREGLFLAFVWAGQAIGIVAAALTLLILKTGRVASRFLTSVAILILIIHLIGFFLTLR